MEPVLDPRRSIPFGLLRRTSIEPAWKACGCMHAARPVGGPPCRMVPVQAVGGGGRSSVGREAEWYGAVDG